MLVNVDQKLRAKPTFPHREVIADYQNGGLISNAYDELLFPSVFKNHAETSIETELKNSSKIFQIFNATPSPNPSPKDRETLVKNWFMFFDEVFFFKGFSKLEFKEKIMFTKPSSLADIPDSGSFFSRTEIYIDINKKFDENENAIWKGDWSAWAISALLHEMLHGFFIFYGQLDCLPANMSGLGESGHGKPFINSIFHLNSALEAAVKGRFLVDAGIPPMAIHSMVQEEWRPRFDEIYIVESWGFPKKVAMALTQGAWMFPNKVNDELSQFVEEATDTGRLPDANDYL